MVGSKSREVKLIFIPQESKEPIINLIKAPKPGTLPPYLGLADEAAISMALDLGEPMERRFQIMVDASIEKIHQPFDLPAKK